MDGFEACRLIRQWEATQKRPPVPIIALTAHVLEEHLQKCLKSGMNGHLSKPLDVEQLGKTLDALPKAPSIS